MTTTDPQLLNALTIPRLTMLAGVINDAHQEVGAHAKGMLLEAKRAGDALLAAKKECQHGSFREWVGEKANEGNCDAPYKTACEYMQVARIASDKLLDLQNFEGGIRTFLEAHRKRRNTSKNGEASTFTKAEAEYAQKLHAMATRGATEGEREAGQRKLRVLARS